MVAVLGAAALGPGVVLAADEDPVVEKAGTATSTGSPSEVVGGDTVDWTIRNTALSDQPVRVETIDTIGPGSQLVPGSVVAPDGWQVSYSNTGPAGPFTDPPSTTTRSIRVVSGDEPGTVRGGITDFWGSEPIQTRGDGWVPVLSGGPRTYNVFHHTNPGKPEINCVDRAARSTCPGYPVEVSIGEQSDLTTPFEADSVLDGRGRLWISGTRAKAGPDEGGFYCWDTTTTAPCPVAWFPVADQLQQGNPYAPVSHSPFSGVASLGTRIYGAAVNLPTGQQANRINVECFDTATLTRCGTVNVNTVGLPGWDPNQFPAGRSPTLSMEVVGSRFYFVVDYGSNPSLLQSRGNRLFCFDMAAGQACEGWKVPAVPGTTSGFYRLSGLVFPDAEGAAAVCVGSTFADPVLFGQPNVSRPVNCFDGTGGPGPVPPGLQAAINGVPKLFPDGSGGTVFAALAYVAATSNNRLWIPFLTDTTKSRPVANSYGLCYDFATDGPCAGVGTAGAVTFPEVNAGRLSLYGFVAERNGCLLGLGDEGWQISFSDSGTTGPCPTASARLQVDPKRSYCRTTPNVTWSAASLLEVDPTTLRQWSVTVRNPDGSPVPGFVDVPGVGLGVDLTNLPPAPSGGYTFDASLTFTDATLALDPGAQLQVTFDGPPPEICLQTSVPRCEDTGTVTNEVLGTVTDRSGATRTGTATASLAKVLPPDCPTTTTSTTSSTTSTTSSTTTSSTTSTTSSTTTSSTTSTTSSTTTSSTTTSTSTSTTSTSTTSTTVPVDVLPATTIATNPESEVAGRTATRSGSSALAVTGANVLRLLVIGLLAVGGGLLILRSRRD